jgi:hypothetical protein
MGARAPSLRAVRGKGATRPTILSPMSVPGFALGLVLGLASLEQGFREAVPPCPEEARHCIGIELFVVLEEGQPVQTPAWWAGQVAHANRLFAPVDVAFELVHVRFIPHTWAHVHSRLDRDRLGRRQRASGVVHVFMVSRLDDVDIEGNLLYGVHWRDRARIENRWIIVSARDTSSTVLVHEMGHYFGLPHSGHDVSVMNKRPREVPAWPDRVFADPELERIGQHRDRMLASGFLAPR